MPGRRAPRTSPIAAHAWRRTCAHVILGTLFLTCTEAPATSSPPPGVPPFTPELQQRLKLALAAKSKDYRPRTHHLHEDGSPKYTNRLILETSPYLIQHAHNPVNWYPWGREAFETAKQLGRPVLLSVGYSTCHWCHVMERESFEDEEIARYLNENYITIKVDREERPDVDSIYMAAVQMLTGHGGWPMTVWLTPAGTPFYAGTYFPARDGERGARMGFLTLSRAIRERYAADSDEAARLGKQLAQTLKAQLTAAAGSGSQPGADVLDTAIRSAAGRFDPIHGGVGGAPKFPSSFPVRLLLRQHKRTGKPELLDMSLRTLEQMARGGIHDQVGGGFHRYSTDATWLLPHFEKMLYDNALLALAYLEGYQASGRQELAGVARDILQYVQREMTSPQGAFYSATDADSPTPAGHSEEGYFFTWTPDELKAVLGTERSRVASAYYGVTLQGNFEGRSVLHRPRALEEVARQLDMPREKAEALIRESRELLYTARARRPPPLRDDKILTSWNGLMISALAAGSQVLNEPAFSRQAARAADFILSNLRREGRLLRSYKDGRAQHNAYLDDHAFLIAGLLDLYEASFDARWLEQALEIQGVLDRHYWDSPSGGYFMTSDDHEALLAREKPAFDGAEPSGNSVALLNLARLHELTGRAAFRTQADKLLRAFAPQLQQAPGGFGELLLGLDFLLGRPKEIVIVTRASKSEAEPFLAELRRMFVPNRVLVVAVEGADLEQQAKLVPLLQGKVAKNGKVTAYVCEQGVCQLPVTDTAAFAKQLR